MERDPFTCNSQINMDHMRGVQKVLKTVLLVPRLHKSMICRANVQRLCIFITALIFARL